MAALGLQNLYSSIVKGDLSKARLILDTWVESVDDQTDLNGGTPLMFASEKGHLHIVRELVFRGADVNKTDWDSWTALIYAAKEGHPDVVQELLDRGAHLETRDMGGWTALVWASYKGNVEVVKILLNKGANSNIKGEHHMSSLLWASGRGHWEIVKLLLVKGAKSTSADKYGTTALVWACRKGYKKCVQALLQCGANVDTAGMNSWTPLIAATKGNYVNVVKLLLEYSPNVNAVDKDGHTALFITAKEGYTAVAAALIGASAYINVPDRNGDTVLIVAAKTAHYDIIKLLLDRYADVNLCGNERKTALFHAVDRSHVDIVAAVLKANPDLEIATEDGETPLLRAVRHRNIDIVKMLLERHAKVSAVDKRGDTVLHIALRNRHKAITEMLLRNPKDGRLLYRPNNAGETPYSIDEAHQKGILTQIFGARRLNTPEDNENMLGYDLYSSALADMLADPSLCMPITVGLFAKWGSGKSFLLSKLQDEMKAFTSQVTEPTFEFTWMLFWLVLLLVLPPSIMLSVHAESWKVGAVICASVFIVVYTLLAAVWYCTIKQASSWVYSASIFLAKQLNSLELILQVAFCNRPDKESQQSHCPVRFLFSDYHRLTTVGGEKTLARTMGTLCDALEVEFGALTVRLVRVFGREPDANDGRWKTVCCAPCWLVALTLYCLAVAGAALLTYGVQRSPAVYVATITIGCLIAAAAVANALTWWRLAESVVHSQKRRVLHAADRTDTTKMDGFIQSLKLEVAHMNKLVKCIDAFTNTDTRLVVIVDGLDSCEQEKVIQVLDTVLLLFTDKESPFITVLTIDPQVTIKALEQHLHSAFHESSITGMDYLRNLVHLPFYLQNPALAQQVKVAQNGVPPSLHRSFGDDKKGFQQGSPSHSDTFSSLKDVTKAKKKHKYKQRSNTAGSFHSSTGGGVGGGGGGLTSARSGTSFVGSSTLSHTPMSSWDISKVVGNHDYFSDINPRNMRRLMNIVYITGRLLRAFSIEFQWLKLASWVYITEQWPYRISWVILYFEREEANLEDNLPLKVIYDRIKDDIPTMKEVEPLLEIDRNPRKFDVFLSSGSVSVKLTVADMRLFLLFAINLDPYLRKIIKENMQVQDNLKLELNHYGYPPMVFPGPDFTRVRKASSTQQPIVQSPMFSPVCGHPVTGYPPEVVMHSMTPQASYARSMEKLPFKLMPDKRLSSMTVEEVCEAFKNVEAVSQPNLQNYLSLIADNNVNGQVLLMCDLDELKKVMGMNFGDWEMFRLLVLTLREREYHAGDCADISIGSDTPVDAPPDSPHVKFYLTDRPQPHLMRPVPKYPTLTKPEQPGELNTIVELSRQQEDVPIVTVSSCHTIQDSDADDEDNDGMGLDTARSNMLRNDSMLRQVEHESNMLHTVLHNSCLTSSGASSDSEAVDAASQVTPDNGSRYSSDDEDDDDLHKPPHRHGDRSTPRDREMVVLSMPVAVDDDDDDGLEVLLGGAASSASSESGYPDRDSDDDDGGGRGRHAARDYQTEDDDDTSSLDEDDLLLHRRPLSRHDSLASHSVEMLHKLADKVKLFVAEHSPHHTGGATSTRSDSLMEDLDERLEMQESATQGRGAGAGTPASTPDTASTTRTATVTPDAGSLTPAVSPDSSSVPPVGSPLSYTTAPAGSPLSYTTAPAGSPLLYTTAPAGPADVRPPSANDPTCSAFVEVRRCGDAKVAPPVGRSMSYEMLKGGQRHLRCVDGSTDSLCATHEPALMCAQVDPVSGSFHSELVARQPADVAPDALQGSVV